MKKSHFIICIILMVFITTLTYSNHFGNAFQFDDSHTVADNEYIRDIHNVPLFFKDGTTFSTLPANQAYRPLVSASFAIDYWLGNGYNLFYFHLITFIIFLLQGILLVFLFRKLLLLSSLEMIYIDYISIIAATLYMLHPAIAETINYVSARSDTLSTFFVVLAAVLYMYSAFCRKFLLYLIPIFIGALAKPTVVMFAPILFFYIVFFKEKMTLYQLFKGAYFNQTLYAIKQSAPSFIFCLFTYWFINKMTPATWVPGGDSLFLYLITQPFVIQHYFATFFVPNGLSADSDWQLLSSMADFRFFIGIIFIVLMIMIAFYTSKKAILRPISFGIIWFFLGLIPSSSIIPLGEVVNDHRMFFPFVGLVLSVTLSFGLMLHALMPILKRSIGNIKPILFVVVVLILFVYAYATNERNKVWHTGESLWYDVTIKSPNNPRGQMNYGLSLMAKGDYNGAINYYKKTLDKWPYYSYAYVNMGIAQNALRNTIDAEANFKKAMQYGSQIPDTYSFYAQFLMGLGRNAEAAPIIEKGLSISPKHASLVIYKQQNILVMNKSNTAPSDKITTLTETIKKVPTAENYIELSLQYYNVGAFEKCIEAANLALRYKPNYDLAYNNICAAYNQLKNWDKAIEAGEKGLQANPKNELLKNNLAEAKKNKGVETK